MCVGVYMYSDSSHWIVLERLTDPLDLYQQLYIRGEAHLDCLIGTKRV